MSDVLVSEQPLHDFVTALFRAVGVPEDHANRAARALIWADLRGVASHGVRLVPMNLRRLQNGGAKPKPDIRRISGTGALELWDGDFGLGMVIASLCMERATELATEYGVGWVSAHSGNHLSAAGAYAAEAVARGYVGISLSNSSMSVAIHGSATRSVGNNPMSIGIPTPQYPLILDMSAGISSGGRLGTMRRLGISIPEEWFVAPKEPAGARPAIVPMGALEGAGAKGSGIAIMIEALTGVIAAGGILSDLMKGVGFSATTPDDSSFTMIALDPRRFLSAEEYAEKADSLVRQLKAVPPALDVEEILLPGERGWREAEHRREHGIPFPEDTIESLEKTAAELGVAPPWA